MAGRAGKAHLYLDEAPEYEEGDEPETPDGAYASSPLPQLEDEDEEDAKLRSVFDEVDADGSGFLDREELGLLSKMLGKKLKKKHLDKAMQAMDPDGDEMVTFEEFREWWTASQASGGGLFGGMFKKIWRKEKAPPAAHPKASPSILRTGSPSLPAVEQAPAAAEPSPQPSSRAGRKAAKRAATLRSMDTGCQWVELGCAWHGDSSAAAAHASTCEYRELSPSEIAGTAPRDQHVCPFAGAGCTAVFRSHRPLAAHARIAADKHLELLAGAFGEAVRERAELERHCAAQERTVASLQRRAVAAERAAADLKASSDDRTAAQRSLSPTVSGGVDWQDVQRRLQQAETKRKQAASAISTAARAAMGRVKAAEAASQETLRSLTSALQPRVCVNCGATYTEGGNTSHSCVYHPGVLMRDNKWSCCRRPCLAGAASVPGVTGDGGKSASPSSGSGRSASTKRRRGKKGVVGSGQPGRLVDGCICDLHRDVALDHSGDDAGAANSAVTMLPWADSVAHGPGAGGPVPDRSETSGTLHTLVGGGGAGKRGGKPRAATPSKAQRERLRLLRSPGASPQRGRQQRSGSPHAVAPPGQRLFVSPDGRGAWRSASISPHRVKYRYKPVYQAVVAKQMTVGVQQP